MSYAFATVKRKAIDNRTGGKSDGFETLGDEFLMPTEALGTENITEIGLLSTVLRFARKGERNAFHRGTAAERAKARSTRKSRTPGPHAGFLRCIFRSRACSDPDEGTKTP